MISCGQAKMVNRSRPRKRELRGLADLALSPDQRRALSRQGFVAAEYRGTNGRYFKLRFRYQGRQAVRYLGTNREVADRIQRELVELQAGTRLDRTLARLAREVQEALRRTKRRLEPYVEDIGYRFHGFELRRRSKQSFHVAQREATAGRQFNAAAGNLMWMSFRLKEAIEAALDKEGNSLERFEKLMPAIDKYLRLTRQIDRFAKLGRQLEAARQSDFPRKPR